MEPTHHSGERIQAYRARLRASGLRPVQIWVPDVRSPKFKQELKQQVQLLNPAHETEVMTYYEQTIDDYGWQ